MEFSNLNVYHPYPRISSTLHSLFSRDIKGDAPVSSIKSRNKQIHARFSLFFPPITYFLLFGRKNGEVYFRRSKVECHFASSVPASRRLCKMLRIRERRSIEMRLLLCAPMLARLFPLRLKVIIDFSILCVPHSCESYLFSTKHTYLLPISTRRSVNQSIISYFMRFLRKKFSTYLS